MSLFSPKAHRRRKMSVPPRDPEELVAWMRVEFNDGQYRNVWQHRLELGYEFVQGDMGDLTWFWLNAYPALAALRQIPKIEHVFVSTCAGYADLVYRGLGPEEAKANKEIAQRFFG